MANDIKRIVIVGAGIAGSRLAYLLADHGKEVLLLDGKAPWEKPCGGGITPKSMWMMPEIGKLSLEPREHKRVALTFPGGRRVKISFTYPMMAVSREKLGRGMLDFAMAAGAEFKMEKVLEARREGDVSVVRSDGGEYEADLVVGADGVGSLVRRTFAEKFGREDLCLTYSVLFPEEVKLPITLSFFPGVQGYAWIFPRKGETSVGVAMENGEATAKDLKEKLSEFVTYEFNRVGLKVPDVDNGKTWFLPALRPASIEKPALAGDGWALIGDASGACDPVTGEGIYYALYTAEALARAVRGHRDRFLDNYLREWKSMAAFSILKTSYWRDRFYKTRNMNLLGFLLDYSPTVRVITRDLLSGAQEYSNLKARIVGSTRKIVLESAWSLIRAQKGERE